MVIVRRIVVIFVSILKQTEILKHKICTKLNGRLLFLSILFIFYLNYLTYLIFQGIFEIVKYSKTNLLYSL